MKQLDPNAPAYPVEELSKYDSGIVPYPENGLTIKQHACIQLELPESGVEWLDELIKKKQLQTLAGQAMQGFIASNDFVGAKPICKLSVSHAKELLNELNKEVI